jgi:DNA-directed RNA polymerase subunit beta
MLKKSLILTLNLFCYTKEDANQGDYAIIHNTLQKDPTNSGKEAAESIFIDNYVTLNRLDEETARGIIDKLFF